MLTIIPFDVLHTIYRMKHELCLSESFVSITEKNSIMRRIKLAVQAYAIDGHFQVKQLKEGNIGHHITISGGDQADFGHHWRTYDTGTHMLHGTWDMFTNKNEVTKGWGDSEWNYYCGSWKEELGNGFVRVRLMFSSFPNLPGFDEFHALDQHIQYEFFWTYFHGFLPVEVILPSHCVSTATTPLDEYQLAVKYNFSEDLEFVRRKVNDMNSLESDQDFRTIVMKELMNFFLVKPAVLIHCPELRESLHQEMDAIMEWHTDKRGAGDLYQLMQKMYIVLSDNVEDPLYNHGK